MSAPETKPCHPPGTPEVLCATCCPEIQRRRGLVSAGKGLAVTRAGPATCPDCGAPTFVPVEPGQHGRIRRNGGYESCRERGEVNRGK